MLLKHKYCYVANKGTICISTTSIILIIFQFILSSSCEKFITIPPPKDQLVSATVYSNDATATSVINGMYSQMMSGAGFASGSSNSVTSLLGLSADELTNYSTDPNQSMFYSNSLLATNPTNFTYLWQEPYKYINNANAVIEGLSTSTGVTAATKSELLGEAKFVRAFCYFYLVNMFGDVPQITSTNYQVNAIASRAPKSQVYQLIVSDLKDAQSLLSIDYSFSNGERIIPNKWAATALLARTYLYTGDWENSAGQADSVISNTGTYSLVGLDSVFLANSSEAIWQISQVPDQTINTWEGFYFILTSTPYDVALSQQLYNSFETGDGRKTNWVGSFLDPTSGLTYYFPFKYKIQTGSVLSEYSMVLRLAEQYLIRAEAEANGAPGGINAAVADLNVIRNRAGLSNYSGPIDQNSILNAIYHERQVELFTEWGHRWLDLKRTNTIDSVMGSPGNACQAKGGSWSPNWSLYPIPQSEIINDNMLKQNPGYN